ncbi:hypothetical protein [uncultured Gammaproteobacteria bacterium]|nr:hypothetical protein BROOK1789B_1748 [Bathymodiolus brooksi thiotrophic gill symbiont]CAB9543601.1 hypothetical protein BROOK1789C_1065 [Bathymodiolus brooksi thiotrophic gill symbiont]CAC9564258.1 hypothetical protein [uncultured Gammaproteobacteria bacterium]CAC9608893.1 hypothetical protein [uncultured Gammaproteobacteria bacterium]
MVKLRQLRIRMLAVFLFANCVNKDNAQNFNSTKHQLI